MWLERKRARKVPRITAAFWAVKLLTTAMGESISDYAVHRFDPVAAVAVGFAGFVVALCVQLRLPRYSAVVYWATVAMVAVFGTMAADVLHVRFHVAYVVSTAAFAVVLAAVFVTWYRSEGTLSIHTIDSTRRELFYWCTVAATFALGTAVGDLTATTIGLGYFGAGVLFACLIALPGLGWRFGGLNAVVCFWTAYVLTRPLGASIADWLGKPRDVHGLAYGDGPVGATFFALFLVAVAWLALTGFDARRETSTSVSAAPSPR